jgi:hypothetical protein
MRAEKVPARRGRPKGASYTVPIRSYESEEGARLVDALAAKRGVSTAALLRLLVREEAVRQGLVSRGDWAGAAQRLRGYYATSPEVAEWEAAEDGYLEHPAPTDQQPEE